MTSAEEVLCFDTSKRKVVMTDEDRLKAMRDAFNMTKQRCLNPKCKDYPFYGGRGITICTRWLMNFNNLVSDLGIRPDGMTLERIDNDGPYSPENCVWAPRKAQAINRRCALTITYLGETKTVSEWADSTGIPYSTIKARLTRLGYSAHDCLTKPVKSGAKSENKAYAPRKKPDMSKVSRGYDSSLTSLTLGEVLEMRRLYALGGQTFSGLGRRYGVSVETSSNAIQGLGAYKVLT